MSTLVDDVEAERAYWEASAAGDARWEFFSVPGIETWDEGIEVCLRQIAPVLVDLPLQARVLDLGCGIGRLALPLARLFPSLRFIGLDISRSMTAAARMEAKPLRNARFVTGDGRTLPKAIPNLAAAFSVLTFQHIPSEAQERYVRSIAERLEPGGVVRLQFVTTDVDHFLSHGVSPDAVAEWCLVAGLTMEAMDLGVIDESWAWVTARKLT